MFELKLENKQDFLDVHSRKLGDIILQVHALKNVRYGAFHADYYAALEACYKEERKKMKPRSRTISWLNDVDFRVSQAKKRIKEYKKQITMKWR